VKKLAKPYKGPFRLLGVSLSNLAAETSLSLFEEEQNKSKLWEVIESLKDKGLDIKKAAILEDDPEARK